MKEPYIEPDIQAISLNLEMGILAGGSGELFNPNPDPGEWDPFPFSNPFSF
jgi:hypothetical protein